MTFYILDNAFFDFPYHLDIDTWDEGPKYSKEDYMKYLNAFNDVNSSRHSILFAWCFFTNISYLAEAVCESKWKRPHKFTQLNTFKQEFSRAAPYDSICEEVICFSTLDVLDFNCRKTKCEINAPSHDH